jgi:hypothetical protein
VQEEVSFMLTFESPTAVHSVKDTLPFAWPHPLLLVILYSLTFLIVGSALHVQYGFPLDDSYIHQTVAGNLVHYGIPGFIPGQRSSGATSLIWTYLQAARYQFLASVDPVTYNFFFSWIMLCLIGPLLFLLARRDGLPLSSCWLLAAAPALCGNFIWLGMIGMEHLLFVMLSLVAIYFWFDASANHLRSAILAGSAAGLLACTRPEAIVFGPLLFFSSLRQIKRSRTDIGTALGIWAVFLAIILGANLYTSNALMPATLKGRSWLYFHTSGGPHSLHSVERFLGAYIQRLPRMFSTHFVGQISALDQVHGLFVCFGFALAAIALVGVLYLLSQRPLRVGFLVFWAAIHFLTYLLTFPAAGHGGRYQPLSLLLFFPLLFFGALATLQWLFSAQTQLRNVIMAVLLLLAGVSSLTTWRTVTIDGIAHINDTHGRVVLWLKQHASADANIAAFDIGRISYGWGRGITDLGGLADPSYFPFLSEGRVAQYLQLKHIQYLVLPSQGMEDLGFKVADLSSTNKVAEYCSPTAPWLLGFRYTIHATQCQQVYQLDKSLGTQPSITPQTAVSRSNR